jgi:aromatic-L-amino-acid/L-tryptophan decarboxylase
MNGLPANTRDGHLSSRSLPRWEWSPDEIKRVGYRVVDMIAAHLTTLRKKAVFQPFPSELAEKYLNSELPDSGQEVDDILATFAREIEPYPFGNGHPCFWGWVNPPPTILGIFGDALAASMNPSCAGGNHAAIYVEREVTNWFRQIVGFPPEAMGLLVSGGSIAALTGLAVARHVHCGYDIRTKGLDGSLACLRFYRTAEGHGCHQKAIELLGIGSENLRVIPHDRSLRMIPAALDATIREDLRSGFRPVAVIASAGAVNTGAIDPLDEIADVCAEHRVWLHVDGAYGAPAILTAQYAKQLSALSRADSLALDPHKWLYVPVEAGLVLVRDAQQMRSTFSLVPPYLQTDGKVAGVGGLPWFSEYGYQQTRGFRALKVWMALRYHGLDGYKNLIEHDIMLAKRLFEALRAAGDFDVFQPQSLSIVCFRYAPANLRGDSDAMDAANRAILERIQLGGRIFLSGTTLENEFWLRACIVNPGATVDDVGSIIDVIRTTATE